MNSLLQKCRTCEFRSVDRCRVSNRPIAALTECPLESEEKLQRLDAATAPTLETDRIAREVTIGISAFLRPDKVEQQVASIRARYPATRILVVDNGDRPADVARYRAETVTIPFDAGLAACRNEMARRLETPYLFICDDDYVWTDETDLGKLLSVLDDCPAAGVCAGSLVERSPRGDVNRHWGQRLVRCGDEIESRPLPAAYRATRDGVRYRLTDTVMNFALFRRELALSVPWEERLKIHEHIEFYWRLKQRGDWLVALCEEVTARHERQHRCRVYERFRGRKEKFTGLAGEIMGVSGFPIMSWTDPRLNERGGPRGDRLNAIVLTVGNTGSRAIVEMALRLGWHCPDADETWREAVAFREINSRPFDRRRAQDFLAQLPQPWILKDPRFTDTCDDWRPLLKEYRPLLLYVTRARADVLASYRRRAIADPEELFDQRETQASRIWQRWPWGRLQLEWEDLVRAAAVIDASPRPRADHVRPGDFAGNQGDCTPSA